MSLVRGMIAVESNGREDLRTKVVWIINTRS